VRIIGGHYRGKKITAPENLPVRPTTDYAKTALFNILNSRYNFESLKVLDLYSGSGSILYEFLSRGSENITAVDSSSYCVNFINSTLLLLKAPASAKIIRSDAGEYLLNSNEKFDIIFADPPFDDNAADMLIEKVFSLNKLEEKGLFILEHKTGNNMSEKPYFITSRKYGNITFSFFGNNAEF
jgi:16S rRNA (guanine966-N2)-methyltransferase